MDDERVGAPSMRAMSQRSTRHVLIEALVVACVVFIAYAMSRPFRCSRGARSTAR